MIKQPSKYLVNRRFRRRLKSVQKRKELNRRNEKDLAQNRWWREQGKKIHTLEDAINLFMPNHFKYLISNERSPFYVKNLNKEKYRKTALLNVPEKFSIIDNPDISYRFIKSIISTFVYQSCGSLWLDYKYCKECDLPTQVFLDSILIDNDIFIRRCQNAGKDSVLRINSVGGRGINVDKLQKMINSVGSPVELINRKINFPDIIPFRLRHIDSYNSTKQLQSGQKEIDASDLIDYVMTCINKFGHTLTQDAKQELGYILGETIANAEEHSSLKNRYLIGYMEETQNNDGHWGLLNLVIMNTGKTIYEKFKNPSKDEHINQQCLYDMKALSDKFKSRNIFSSNKFTEEDLWTLYSLQGGVSIIPPEVRKRGNGTIEFIDSFFKIKGSNEVDDISKMSIISGGTQIDFDGTYRIDRYINFNGEKIGRMTFNKSNTLEEKPDHKYVYHIDNYFPGTLICVKLLINQDDIQNEEIKS